MPKAIFYLLKGDYGFRVQRCRWFLMVAVAAVVVVSVAVLILRVRKTRRGLKGCMCKRELQL